MEVGGIQRSNDELGKSSAVWLVIGGQRGKGGIDLQQSRKRNVNVLDEVVRPTTGWLVVSARQQRERL